LNCGKAFRSLHLIPDTPEYDEAKRRSIFLASKTATPIECLHYAMNLPTSTVITGIDSIAILKQDLEVVKTFRPLTEAQVADLLARTAQTASRGKFVAFKTTNGFDGTAKNPSRLGEADAGPG
jgi:hypothetical protein